MPNPTTNFGWVLPLEGQDPWQDTVNSVFNAIDTAVNSIATSLMPKMTMVISAFPDVSLSQFLIVTSDTYTNMGADGPWTICSVSPYGRLAGSFSIISSGAQITMDLRTGGYGGGSGVGSYGGISACSIKFRAVINRTGASSLVYPNNSSWIATVQPIFCHVNFAPFIDVHSIGPGNYSIELQGRTIVGATSAFFISPYAMLTVLESRR